MKTPVLFWVKLIALSILAVGCAPAESMEKAPTPPPSAKAPPQLREWNAWLDKMPPGPPALHLVGQVYVSHGGMEARLSRATPQGTNFAILVLDLTLTQKPGPSTQGFKWVDTRFDEAPARVAYQQVQIRYEGETLQTLTVSEVH